MIDVIVDGVLRGGVYALAAIGYVLVYRASKVINLAYGAMALAAAYLYWYFSSFMPMPLAMALVLLATVLVAIFVERGIMRPMIGEPVVQIIMATIGVSYIIKGALLLFLQLGAGLPGWLYVPFVQSPLPQGTYSIGPLNINANFLWASIASFTGFIIFYLFYSKTPLGIAMRAMSNDRQSALTLAIRPTETFLLSWLLAGIIAFLSGLFYASITGGVSGNVELIAIKALPVIILGGLDSITGSVVGGIIVGLLESIGKYYLDSVFGGGFGEVFPLLVMIFIMLIKPYGLFGTERIERI
ncbi:branched-chain amino acid ABC transporter permease [Pyrobaculum sp.]|nr:branched-chain amino acid ABC transporter permease [Pyrobaculum sp.]